MTIKTEKATYRVYLKIWTDGWNAGYSPDVLDDLWTDIGECAADFDYAGAAWLMTEDMFHECMDWWSRECDRCNADRDYESDALGSGLPENQLWDFYWKEEV